MDVSETTRARDGVDDTTLRFPFEPVVLLVEADKERGKALGGPVPGRFKCVGIVESMFEVEFEFEIGLAGFTVVQPLASLVIESARVLREVRVVVEFDVVRDNDKRERVDVSDGVGILVQWLVSAASNHKVINRVLPTSIRVYGFVPITIYTSSTEAINLASGPVGHFKPREHAKIGRLQDEISGLIL